MWSLNGVNKHLFTSLFTFISGVCEFAKCTHQASREEKGSRKTISHFIWIIFCLFLNLVLNLVVSSFQIRSEQMRQKSLRKWGSVHVLPSLITGKVCGLGVDEFLNTIFEDFLTIDGSDGGEFACQYRRPKRCWFDPWARKIPWWRAW